MVYRKNQRKKSLMMCIVAIVLFIVGVTAGTITYAYFSDSAKAENTLNFGKLKIEMTGGTGSTSTQIMLSGIATNTNSGLATSDKVKITGTVGLESGSVDAYIRMKIRVYDENTGNEIKSTFNKAFMAEMEKIQSGSMKWFMAEDGYMYLGNSIKEGEAFVYSDENTNTSKNIITLNDDMTPTYFEGENIKVVLIYQAIQSSGLNGNVKENVYTENNAISISNIPAWQQVFGPNLNEIYDNEYAISYVRGTLNETAYKTGAQVVKQMTKSPYNYFEKSSDNTGNYVAFGFFPQTIKADSVEVNENLKETFNGITYFIGNDGYLYEKVEESVGGQNYTYSNGKAISQVSANSYRYFKLEPIIWQVLTKSDGNAYLLSVSALTASAFGSNSTYKDSTINGYLNGEFYNKAFGANKALINETTLKIGKANNVFELGDATNYNAESTDTTTYKVFLPSATDFVNVAYGFSVENAADSARVKYATDYAGSKGAYTNGDTNNVQQGTWLWSRSSYLAEVKVWRVTAQGSIYIQQPSDSGYCVVPALFLNI